MNPLDGLLPLPGVAPRVDWTESENALGIVLPTDYKRFAEDYGPGAIDGFLWVLHPEARSRNIRLGIQLQVRLDALRALRASSEQVPYPIFPEPSGVVPWGFTDNGDVLYWLTVGPPDAWIVVGNESRGPRWQEHRGSMTQFIRAVIERRLVVSFFPPDFPSNEPVFIPEAKPH